jgi:hypothetical protein
MLIFAVVWNEPRALNMLGKHSVYELYDQPWDRCFQNAQMPTQMVKENEETVKYTPNQK